jgi:hypothetical protein
LVAVEGLVLGGKPGELGRLHEHWQLRWWRSVPLSASEPQYSDAESYPLPAHGYRSTESTTNPTKYP